MQIHWPSLLKWWLCRLRVWLQKTLGKMIIEEEVLVKKEGASSKRVVVTGCGNAYNADAMVSSLIDLMDILKKNGIELVTTDQSGIDYHVRYAAKHVGVPMKVVPMHLMPQSLDRETPDHKVSYCNSNYRTGYETIIVEGRKYNENPFFRDPVIVLREDKNGSLSLAVAPKKTKTGRQLRSGSLRVRPVRSSAPQPEIDPWIVSLSEAGIAPITAEIRQAATRDPRELIQEFSTEMDMVWDMKTALNPSDPDAVSDERAIDEIISRMDESLYRRYSPRFSELMRIKSIIERESANERSRAITARYAEDLYREAIQMAEGRIIRNEQF